MLGVPKRRLRRSMPIVHHHPTASLRRYLHHGLTVVLRSGVHASLIAQVLSELITVTDQFDTLFQGL
jgi:hypothetical protein